MREQYFFNRRFQISPIVNCDRWAYLKGSARAEHHTDGGSRIRRSSAERTACSCSRFRGPVHKKVRQLSCQGQQRPHRCGIELRSKRIKGERRGHLQFHRSWHAAQGISSRLRAHGINRRADPGPIHEAFASYFLFEDHMSKTFKEV